MLHDRWNNMVQILANCGTHLPNDFTVSVTLVKVKTFYDDDTTMERFHFADSLRGDRKEIDSAINAAPKVTLLAAELKAAINQAM